MNAQFGFASAVAQALVHSLWQLALLALLAEVSFVWLRQRSAMLRHAVGMGWLLIMLVAPLITFALCWQTPTLSQDGAPILPMPFVAIVGHVAVTKQSMMDWGLVTVAELWLLGVVVMSVLQLGGWRMLGRMERQPYLDLPPEWQRRVDALRVGLGISRTVVVRLASHVSSPFTAHVMRPIIWLPMSFLTHLPPDQIEALLAHELSHIRRLDWCWNALQCVIECVLFFHPGMWWLSARIRQEREHACDDLAVGVSGDPIALAEALAQLQRQRHAFPRVALAAQGGTLMKRITRLLSASPARMNWRVPGALLLLLCSGTLLAMQVTPPKHLLINIKIDTSSNGALTPGNFREFTANYLFDKQSYYRVSMDSQGRVTEIYKENGRIKPVDDKVRTWLANLSENGVASIPSIAPAPPIPPIVSVPPMPPIASVPSVPPISSVPPIPPIPSAPPRPPVIDDSVDLKKLFEVIRTDQRLVDVVGTPVAIVRDSFHGSVHTWGSWDFHFYGIDDPVGGKAAFAITAVGPKGRATIDYAGKTRDGVWQSSKMDISPVVRK